MIGSELAKAQLDKVWVADGDDPDYAGLHQGEAGTKLRHSTVIELLAPHLVPGYQLIDWGCGTALLLKSLADAGLHLPGSYIGVDFLEHRRSYVENRCIELGIGQVLFSTASRMSELPLFDTELPTITVAIGIMGYPGLHTLRQIKTEIDEFRLTGLHGAITVPRQMPERLGEAEMARYDPLDLQDALSKNRYKFAPVHTDTVVYW